MKKTSTSKPDGLDEDTNAWLDDHEDWDHPQSFQQMVHTFFAAATSHVIAKRRSYGPEAVLDQGLDGQAKRLREKAARILNLLDDGANLYEEDGIIQEIQDMAGICATMDALARGYWRRETIVPPLLEH